MKLAKLSLVTIVVAGLTTSSFAADTLADAFKNGKMNGEIKAYYFDREGSPNLSTAATEKINSDIFTTGIMLHYNTDAFYGFKLGATMQSSSSPFADGAIGTAGTAKDDFKNEMYGSGTVLSEAYIEYTLDKTSVKVGRQFINTPLVAGSPSRIILQSFEGAMITNTDLPQTTVVAGVVTKYQDRTDFAGNIAEFQNLDSALGSYAYTLLAINKSLSNTTLTAQWLGINGNNTATGVGDFYYLEAAYANTLGEYRYGLAINHEYKATEKLNEKDGKMYGAKVSVGYGDFNTYVAYTTITKDGDIKGNSMGGGLGGGTQTVFAKGLQNKPGTFTKDTDAYSVDANYYFKNINFKLGARYTGVDDNANDKEYAYTDIYTTYTFVGALKGLSTDIMYQDWGKDANGHDFWFKANYKF
jgi:imipenem/basic amino acid-specific outer membrane pore